MRTPLQKRAREELRELGYRQASRSTDRDAIYETWEHETRPAVILKVYRPAIHGAEAGCELFEHRGAGSPAELLESDQERFERHAIEQIRKEQDEPPSLGTTGPLVP